MSAFITFEGGEGSGKSYQARVLFHHLKQIAVPALLVHEPGSTPLGEKLGRLLKHSHEISMTPVSELFLFNAARAQLVSQVIKPALKQGMVVVSDRYTDSTVAYQGKGRGLELEKITALNKIATRGLKPDLTFLLDIPVEEGLARKRKADADRFEREELAFHRRVRRGYLTMAREEPERFIIIDGRQDRKTIAGIVWKRVSELLRR